MTDQNCWRAFCGALVLLAAGTTFCEEPPPPAPQKVVLQVELKVVDVNMDKLKALGFRWSQLEENGPKEVSFDDFLKTLEKGKSVDRALTILQALRENDLAHFLAEPTIATLDGRPASLAVGTTKLDVVPILLGDGRVRLDCRLELFATPNDRFNLDTAMEVERGTTYLVSHMRTKIHATDKPQEAEILVLAKVESLNSALQR
jgi:hypothetical protein